MLFQDHPLKLFCCGVSDLLDSLRFFLKVFGSSKNISVKVDNGFSAYLLCVWNETELRVCIEAVYVSISIYDGNYSSDSVEIENTYTI